MLNGLLGLGLMGLATAFPKVRGEFYVVVGKRRSGPYSRAEAQRIAKRKMIESLSSRFGANVTILVVNEFDRVVDRY
jgi:hypothetical protein